MIAKLSPEKAHQLGWNNFVLDQNQVEELNYQMQQDITDISQLITYREDYFDEYEEFDCGFVTGEGSSMAGSEDCDFECPYRDNLMKHPAYPNCDLLAADYSM